MRTFELLIEIERLPISKKIYLIEKTLHSIRISEEKDVLREAADALYNDYTTDKELTAFTTIDFVDFYETK